jgi:tRNA/tmRNA/rRNA uracil-C5-methylase (TrmA/RlmC/RlmD family)
VLTAVVDWGLGQYEQTAAELEPVAEHVISLARLQPEDTVLDLATGTGNAALLAARAGATVTGVDVASRLIDVARERAREAGVAACFVVGELEAPPMSISRTPLLEQQGMAPGSDGASGAGSGPGQG